MGALCERLLAAPAEVVILALDEHDIHLPPVVRGVRVVRERNSYKARMLVGLVTISAGVPGSMDWTPLLDRRSGAAARAVASRPPAERSSAHA